MILLLLLFKKKVKTIPKQPETTNTYIYIYIYIYIYRLFNHKLEVPKQDSFYYPLHKLGDIQATGLFQAYVIETKSRNKK